MSSIKKKNTTPLSILSLVGQGALQSDEYHMFFSG